MQKIVYYYYCLVDLRFSFLTRTVRVSRHFSIHFPFNTFYTCDACIQLFMSGIAGHEYKSSDTNETLSSHISLFSSSYDSEQVCPSSLPSLQYSVQIKVICVNSTSPHSMHQMIHSVCLNVLHKQGFFTSSYNACAHQNCFY